MFFHFVWLVAAFPFFIEGFEEKVRLIGRKSPVFEGSAEDFLVAFVGVGDDADGLVAVGTFLSSPAKFGQDDVAIWVDGFDDLDLLSGPGERVWELLFVPHCVGVEGDEVAGVCDLLAFWLIPEVVVVAGGDRLFDAGTDLIYVFFEYF